MSANTGKVSTDAAGKPTPLRKLISGLGPGLVTGAADDDPSGIGTYTTAGASLGFATLWTASTIRRNSCIRQSLD
jgi:Mn2+/Fe2+ NRAMP family transporter